MDRAVGGGAAGLRDEAARRAGGDGQGQEAEGGQSHPLPGPRCVSKRGGRRRGEGRYVHLKPVLHPGVFDECDTEADVLQWSRHNVFLLYDMGIFTALLELLSMEIE